MTLTDAAKELGVDASTLRYRLKRGDMRGEKVGPRAWMIPVDEVERWRGQGRLKPGRKAKKPKTADRRKDSAEPAGGRPE